MPPSPEKPTLHQKLSCDWLYHLERWVGEGGEAPFLVYHKVLVARPWAFTQENDNTNYSMSDSWHCKSCSLHRQQIPLAVHWPLSLTAESLESCVLSKRSINISNSLSNTPQAIHTYNGMPLYHGKRRDTADQHWNNCYQSRQASSTSLIIW